MLHSPEKIVKIYLTRSVVLDKTEPDLLQAPLLGVLVNANSKL